MVPVMMCGFADNSRRKTHSFPVSLHANVFFDALICRLVSQFTTDTQNYCQSDWSFLFLPSLFWMTHVTFPWLPQKGMCHAILCLRRTGVWDCVIEIRQLLIGDTLLSPECWRAGYWGLASASWLPSCVKCPGILFKWQCRSPMSGASALQVHASTYTYVPETFKIKSSSLWWLCPSFRLAMFLHSHKLMYIHNWPERFRNFVTCYLRVVNGCK